MDGRMVCLGSAAGKAYSFYLLPKFWISQMLMRANSASGGRKRIAMPSTRGTCPPRLRRDPSEFR